MRDSRADDPQYESESKRFFPEALNFLAAAVTALLPQRKDAVLQVPFPDLQAPNTNLQLRSQCEPTESADLAAVLRDDSDQTKANLLQVTLRLVETYAILHSSSAAFIEAFQPLLTLLQAVKSSQISGTLQVSYHVQNVDQAY